MGETSGRFGSPNRKGAENRQRSEGASLATPGRIQRPPRNRAQGVLGIDLSWAIHGRRKHLPSVIIASPPPSRPNNSAGRERSAALQACCSIFEDEGQTSALAD